MRWRGLAALQAVLGAMAMPAGIPPALPLGPVVLTLETTYDVPLEEQLAVRPAA